MSDHDAFMWAICDDPSDVFVRLAYADWLEENGPPERSEFIRCQVELTKLHAAGHTADPWFKDGEPKECAVQFTDEGCTECSRKVVRRAREKNLLRQHQPQWLHSLIGIFGHNCPVEASASIGWRADFYRGFVEQVRCHASLWLAHGPEIVRAAPVREVRLTDREPDVDNDSYGATWWDIGHYMAAPRAMQDPEDLPSEWWMLLSGRQMAVGNGYKSYPTAEAAHADLSRACISWARAETRCGTLRAMPEWVLERAAR